MTTRDPARLIESWFAAALAAVEPSAAVQRALRCRGRVLSCGGQSIDVRGRLIVVGAGKAAVTMAIGAEAACAGLIADGLVITKDGHAEGDRPARIRVAEASHPIPGERGVRATREVLALVEAATPDDVVLALISGGGSALLEAPKPPLTLDDLATTTDLLLRAGAPIHDLNAVRIPLSRVKGGGLRRAAGGAPMVTLILSDVLGNNIRIIASGPTVPGTATAADAIAVLDRYDLRDCVPRAVIEVLERVRNDEPFPSTENDVVEIVADNETALDALHIAAEADGCRASIIWRQREGEASLLAREWIDACANAGAADEVLLGGGEATVTVRGTGVGGRNTEFVLAACLELERRDLLGWTVASLATDGQDGPTYVAGAIGTADTPALARSRGVDPETALANNDSLRVFAAAGGVVDPGPTGTNVNDLYVAVRHG